MQWHCRALLIVLALCVLDVNSLGVQKKDDKTENDSPEDSSDVDGPSETDSTTDSDTAVVPLTDGTTNPTPSAAPQGPEDSCSVIGDSKVCAAVKLELSLSVNYHAKDGKNLTDEQVLPDEVKCSGECGDEPEVSLEWKSYKLSMGFEKYKDGDWWKMCFFKLEFSPESVFKVQHEEKSVTLKAKEEDLDIFTAPINQSLACSISQTISLYSESGTLSAYAVLSEARIQAYNVPSEFGPERSCDADESTEEKPKRKYRDDTAPIAVGSTLAILSLGVIAGYAIYRSLTNKKVEYATM